MLDHRPVGVFRDIGPALAFAQEMLGRTGEQHSVHQPVPFTFTVHHAEALHNHLDELESLALPSSRISSAPSIDLGPPKKKCKSDPPHIGAKRIKPSGVRTTLHRHDASRGTSNGVGSCSRIA